MEAMDNNTMQDLKQSISAAIHQEVVDVREDIKKLDTKLTTKIDDLSKSVTESFDTTNETVYTQLEEYGQRILNLEQKIA
jgi:hypothetical protein